VAVSTPRPELAGASAAEIAALVRDGGASAVEVLQACLRVIEEREPVVRAWAHVDPEVGLAAAAALDRGRANGETLGTLAGVPVGVKDVFNTLDLPTEMGSPLWRGFTPGNDARTVFGLRRRDAVVAGKTVTAEFAVHTPGPTTNPHDPARMPGTSSSGSAAAVAAGMVPLALGTQTAGSIVRPASYCGVVGFKPSFGAVPRTGVLKTTDTLDTIGVLSRTVDDAALAFDAIRVHGVDYPLLETAYAERAAHPRRAFWRLAVVTGPRSAEAEPYARAALQALAARLDAEADLELHELTLPEPFDRAHAIHDVIYERSLAYYFKDETALGTPMSASFEGMLERGRATSLEAYKDALRDQAALAAELERTLLPYDALLDLSTGGEALVGLDAVDRPDHCLVWTLCGAPVLSLPRFRGPDGLPFGLQVVARRFDDYRLLELGRRLERAGA
jgi:Asp-tRNA(Asn)/Glu-tRNA(Gln) amidotransferase A subunit family amidase